MARGGMGVVYGARHLVTGRRVAIKLLRAELLDRPDVVWRVSAEGRVAAVAAHPNVVEVLDAGTDEGIPYLVQERLFGEPLEALLGAPLSLRATARALMPVINAVAHLHCSGLIHRDIKPTNIFLARDLHGRVTPKLLDFGLAKALRDAERTLSGVALGTPAYMAPEQALGSRSLGTASDVWSMAVVFIRCVMGQLPFTGALSPRPNTLRLHAEDLSCVPAPVASVLSDALALEPAERIRDMATLRSRLIAALRAVDAAGEWPDETSVSYFAEPNELEHIGGSANSLPAFEVADSSASAFVRGRPQHEQTRTLRRTWRLPSQLRRRSGWLLFAVAGLSLGAFAFAEARGVTKATSPPLPHSSGRASGGTATASASSRTSAPEESSRATAVVVVRPEALRAPGLKPAPAPQRVRKPVATTRPSSGAMTAAPTAERALGSNRAPIIE